METDVYKFLFMKSEIYYACNDIYMPSYNRFVSICARPVPFMEHFYMFFFFFFFFKDMLPKRS